MGKEKMLCETVRKIHTFQGSFNLEDLFFLEWKNFMEYGTQDKMALSWLIALVLLAYLRKKINMW